MLISTSIIFGITYGIMFYNDVLNLK